MKLFFRILSNDALFLTLSSIISFSAFLYFYFHGQQNLSYDDALSRLDIARKIINSITPGVGQLGTIWLPFPSVLMIPFIWNNFLWHSGIAGAIISGFAFIVSAVYLKKTTFFVTKNQAASFIVWLIFVSNSNVLLLQTMAMSESFFLFCVIMTVYFLTRWMLDQEIIQYLLAAFFVMLGTLTRYEGYFIFVGALITICTYEIFVNWKKRNFSKIEGMIFLFLSVASYGIFLWCLYCLIFFKNPLQWLMNYSGDTSTIVPSASHQRTILESFSSYTQITIWMSGLLVTFLGFIGYITLVFSFIEKLKRRQDFRQYLPLVTISSILFLLLVYGYQKGYIPPVDYETITFQHILSKKFDFFLPSVLGSNIPNIRYGLEMLPFIAIFVGVLASRSKVLFFLVLALVVFQAYTNYQTNLLLQFSIPYAARYNILPSAIWLKSHYTQGQILVSDTTNEGFMFESGLSYDKFIYEGTRQYWKSSLINPSHYATYVVFQNLIPGDLVYVASQKKPMKSVLQKKYTLVYSDKKGYKIYYLTIQQ